MLGDVDEPTAPFGLLDVQGDGARDRGGAAAAGRPSWRARLRAQARRLGVSAASLFHLAWAQVLARLSGRDGRGVRHGAVRPHAGRRGRGAGDGHVHQHAAGADRGGRGRASRRRCGGRTRCWPSCCGTSTRRWRWRSAAAACRRGAAVHRAAQLPAQRPERRRRRRRRRARGGGRAGHCAAQERTNYPLTLSVDDLGEEFCADGAGGGRGRAGAGVRLMHTALERLVEALEDAPGAASGALDVLPAAERSRWWRSGTATAADYPRGRAASTAVRGAGGAHARTPSRWCSRTRR